MKMAISKNIPNRSQVPSNPGFMQEKLQKGDFLKKALAGNENQFFVFYESLDRLEW